MKTTVHICVFEIIELQGTLNTVDLFSSSDSFSILSEISLTSKNKREATNIRMGASNKPKEDSSAIPAYDENIENLISKQASSALLYLLFFSILMFTLPFAAFFGTQHLLRTCTDFSEFAITSISVASAVVTVYVIIFLYVYKAYKEKEIIIPEETTSKKKN